MSDKTSAAKGQEDVVAKAVRLGIEFMDSSRQRNAEYERETGEPSKISEQSYTDGENEVAAIFLRHQGIGPIKAKRLIREYREAHDV